MTRALVTRPAEDAAPLIEALKQRGIDAVAEPLLTIRPKPGATLDLAGVQALLFTSANGARAFAKASPVRDLPALAVGDGTAEALRGLGFSKVESASGDVEDLDKLARAKLEPGKGKLLHVAGTTVAGDLAGKLSAAGFQVERAALYDAEPATALTPATLKAIEAGTIDWVVVFSPRTAGTFAGLIGRAGLAEAMRTVTLVALSDAVAKAAALPFRRVVVAAQPTRAALLETVDGLIRNPAMTETPPAADVPPKKRNPFPLILAALLLAAVIGAALYASRPGQDAAPAAARVDLSPISGTVDRLEAAVTALGRRLDGVADEARKASAQATQATQAAAARPDGTAPASSGESPPPTDLGPIETRLAAIEKTLADLGRRAEAIGEIERRIAPLADIEKRLAAIGEIEKRVAALGDLERRVSALATLEQRVTALGAMEQRVAEVERLSKVERRHDVAALAALRLGDAIAAGRPYKAELALLAGNASVAAELQTLAARADAGVPTRAMLIERFPSVAAAATRGGGEQGDFWDRATARLKGLVTIRRVTPGEDVDGRLTTAEQALQRGDLAGAVAAIDAMPDGPAKAALASWRAEAQARLDADQAFQRLTQALAADLGRPG